MSHPVAAPGWALQNSLLGRAELRIRPDRRRIRPTGALAKILERADVRIGGLRPWDIRVHEPRLFGRVLSHGTVGLGEAYMEGWWDCEALDEFFARILRARKGFRPHPSLSLAYYALKSRVLNLQAMALSTGGERPRYGIGNDLYVAMLDTRMNYSCGYWNDAATLDQAQAAKMDLTCRKLRLEPGMRILDIGCGWGGFARFAAERYGARVVGISVSENQVAMAREWCRGLPIEILLRDYRDVHGDFDRVVSMGMFGRVSRKNHGEFMQVANRCLPNGGLCVLDATGDNGTRVESDPWVEKHIFPDDLIPSIAQTGPAMEGQFVVEDWHNLSADYDRTLCAWNANFESQWYGLAPAYGERFGRMWRYYLLQSAGAFRARTNQMGQIVLSKDPAGLYTAAR
jgi:cyclopropane-fatty-acyl-phospholipid synthase